MRDREMRDETYPSSEVIGDEVIGDRRNVPLIWYLTTSHFSCLLLVNLLVPLSAPATLTHQDEN
jgi:hypothetical protein